MQLFFTDLDDTLFSSEAKHATGATLAAEAFLKDGQPISYSSHQQRGLLSMMRKDGSALIPVTARSTEAFFRTSIKAYDSAICSNGAVILDASGDPDEEWQALMAADLLAYQELLKSFEAELAPWAAENDMRLWLVSEESVGFVYCVLKSNKRDHALLQRKAVQLASSKPDWIGTIHCNGNNLGVIPQPVSKARAVRFLIERHARQTSELTTFGIGDSRSDWTFMSDCDFAIMPTASQLAEAFAGSDAPPVRETA